LLFLWNDDPDMMHDEEAAVCDGNWTQKISAPI